MITEAIHDYVAANQRVWLGGRGNTVGASEIGMCARRVVFSKHMDDPGASVERDENHADRWGATKRGSIIEDHLFSPALKHRYGEKAMFVGEDQRTFTKGFLSATPDGLLIDQPRDALAHLGIDDIDGDSIALDCKSIDPRTKLDEPKLENVYQVHVQMGLIRDTTNYQPSYAILTYIDASFMDIIKEFTVRFDPEIYATAQRRAREIMTAKHGRAVKPEGIIAGGKECQYCPWTSQCGQIRADQVPVVTSRVSAGQAELITGLAEKAKRLESDAEEAELRARQIKQQIRELLDEAGTKSLPGVVSWSPVKGRSGWDNDGIRKAAEAAGVDLTPFKKTGDPSDRLTISL